MKNLKNQIAPVSVALAALLIAGNAWAASGNKKATGTMNIGTVDWDAAMGTGDTGTFDNSKFAITPTQLSTMDLGSANISILALVFKNNLQGPWTIGSSGNYFLQLNQNSTYYRGGATKISPTALTRLPSPVRAATFLAAISSAPPPPPA